MTLYCRADVIQRTCPGCPACVEPPWWAKMGFPEAPKWTGGHDGDDPPMPANAAADYEFNAWVFGRSLEVTIEPAPWAQPEPQQKKPE